MIRAAAAIAGLMLAQAPVAASAQAIDGVRLDGMLESAFRACALQINSTLKANSSTYFADPTKTAERTAQGIVPAAALPDGYDIGIARDTFGASTIAKLASPDAALWLVGYASGPVCKVLVGETSVSQAARAEFERRFTATTSWTRDPTSGPQGALLLQLFTLNAARPGPHLVVKLEGPTAVFNEGRGIQAIMTVALIKPETN